MPPTIVDASQLEALIARMRRYPDQLTKSLRVTMQAALMTLWENVPPYPTVDNPVRQGTLGRTLGSSESGGAVGKPDVFYVKEFGSSVEGHFGTNLEYAPYVIGENQAWMHYRWWKITVIAEKAQAKIERLFDTLAQKLADFLEGRSR